MHFFFNNLLRADLAATRGHIDMHEGACHTNNTSAVRCHIGLTCTHFSVQIVVCEHSSEARRGEKQSLGSVHIYRSIYSCDSAQSICLALRDREL